MPSRVTGKVLVVDDDESVVFVLTEVLRDAGFEVVSASNAEQASRALLGISAAIVDLHLAGECGTGLVRQIATSNPELPVLVLTADARPHAAHKASAAGASLVLRKPLDIGTLTSSLTAAVRHRAKPGGEHV